MDCGQCGAIGQRGRFCVRCGRRLPPMLQPMRRFVPVPRRENVEPDMTQPVLRLAPGTRPRPAAGVGQRARDEAHR